MQISLNRGKGERRRIAIFLQVESIMDNSQLLALSLWNFLDIKDDQM